MLFTGIEEQPRLEISEQAFASIDVGEVDPIGHLPLENLYYEAPVLPPNWYDHTNVAFPFSNDESAPYFEAVQTRSATPEYQQAKNRVAIVVGESALAANLKYIPEETIIILDNSMDMCLFMDFYVSILRTSATPDEWIERLRISDFEPEDKHGQRFSAYAIRQCAEYIELNRQHPLKDQQAFDEASAIAKQKAIIPWHADITSEADMQELGAVLREYDATVTMLNLTNVMPFVQTFKTAREYADVLRNLPITPNAPILATSRSGKPSMHPMAMMADMETGHGIVQATGPFFGLDNLAKAGGNVAGRDADGAAVRRKYVGDEDRDRFPHDMPGMLIKMIESGQFNPTNHRGGVIVIEHTSYETDRPW